MRPPRPAAPALPAAAAAADRGAIVRRRASSACGRAVPASCRAALALACAVQAWGLVAPARAQDFTGPAPPGPAGAPDRFLEDALPPAGAAPALAASLTGRYGLPELASGSLAAGLGLGPLRLAAGVAQFGDHDVGWNAAALGLGVVREGGGAGLRAVARRDRGVAPGSAAALRLGARAGAEAGWGAWLRAARGLTLWATVPQAWATGTAPPLERPLEIGVRHEAAGGLAAWLVRAAPARGGAPDHGAGLSLAAGPLVAWGTARDRPLRGGAGLAAAAGRLRVAAEVESHPDLGETVRLSAGLGGRAAERAQAAGPAGSDRGEAPAAGRVGGAR